MPKVISVHSYRGGTGKSNFTANLATSIAQTGKRVGVVDTDVPSPGVHNILGLEPEQMDKTLNNYLWGESTIQEASYDVSQNVGLTEEGKIFLIPSSVKADDIARILKDGYDVKLLNDGFRSLVKELQLDYLFIDTHPGLSKETFLSIAISHILLLIVRPDKQDYQGTAVTVDVARQLKVRNMLIAVNKAHSKLNFDALKQKIEETYHVPVAGIFPLSEDVVQLASEGVFCQKHPEHFISQEFKKVARIIMN
ncbi:CDP-3,6-dideoxy-D-glycero-L-glycero-4-hexulose-4-reductase [Aphanothece hegewaldii CCALA 016]|uniref:CDP-3, 6-dideoxy-D-glycero-L-glycero-4-hexulose-4-reductase n=1 Tax=Aphanothece hegewaldii CCALA 016 TaxID=2107694 RepID=A0A2T1M073_9CHRO|nr:MinD/ParA family protein [Aphanothece hegewaldii]PSF38059.1 CDP-3,6-dideoxy-D-glycero-L-glycero-4-hexulose-4-reductase [Aphanothece hegewaldii CCALA 016]